MSIFCFCSCPVLFNTKIVALGQICADFQIPGILKATIVAFPCSFMAWAVDPPQGYIKNLWYPPIALKLSDLTFAPMAAVISIQN